MRVKTARNVALNILTTYSIEIRGVRLFHQSIFKTAYLPEAIAPQAALITNHHLQTLPKSNFRVIEKGFAELTQETMNSTKYTTIILYVAQVCIGRDFVNRDILKNGNLLRHLLNAMTR